MIKCMSEKGKTVLKLSGKAVSLIKELKLITPETKSYLKVVYGKR